MSVARAVTRSASRTKRVPERPELKVVRRRQNPKLIKRTGARRLAPFTILAVIAIGAIIAAILLEQVVLAQSAFKLTHIRQELAKAEEDREVLMLEAAKLDSAARIERYARENLGMVDPSPNNVRYIVANIPNRKLDNLAFSGRSRYAGAGGVDTAAAAVGASEAP